MNESEFRFQFFIFLNVVHDGKERKEMEDGRIIWSFSTLRLLYIFDKLHWESNGFNNEELFVLLYQPKFPVRETSQKW